MADKKIAQKRPIVGSYEAGTYYWCACGHSATQPFCDGSHAGTEFRPEKVEIAEDKRIAWCACKHSGKGAFCDGTHSKLP